MPPNVEDAALDVVLEHQVLRPRTCPSCGTIWAPVPSRLVALPTGGPRTNGWTVLFAAGDGRAYLYCCSVQVVW